MYQILKVDEDGVVIYARLDDDGKCRLTCTESYPEFQEWVAQGNTPLPANNETTQFMQETQL